MEVAPPPREARSAPSRDSFESLFCLKFSCSPEDFAEELYVRVLYPHAGLLARVIKKMRKEWIERHRYAISQLGQTTSFPEFSQEANSLRIHGAHPGSFLQKTCRFRISGRRLLRLGRAVFRG
jgi:hypothetical protein